MQKPEHLQIAGAIRVVVYDRNGKEIYEQQISPRLIRASRLIDKLEDFFMELSMEGNDAVERNPRR